MNINGQKNDVYIKFDLIYLSLNDLEEIKKSFSKLNINKLIDFSKKFETFYNILYIQKSKLFLSFKRKITYFYKYILNTSNIKIKKVINNEEEFILYFIISFLKLLIENKRHKMIQQYTNILVKLSIDKILSNNYILIIIEIILKILINELNSSRDKFYDINDNSAFNLLRKIINSLISFPEEIKLKISKSNILIDVLNLFDKYLFSQFYPNIFLSTTPIWLNLLSIPFNQTEKNNIKILYSFLTKIYKFHLSPVFMENIIFKSSILDLKYYINSLGFLNNLFFQEMDSIHVSNFKIKEGMFIPRNNYLFLSNIKSKNKTSEISIIFSFQIYQNEKNKNIEILEFLDKKTKSLFKFYISEKGLLVIDNNDNKKLETEIKIKENECYFLCLTIKKNVIKIYENTFFFQNFFNDTNKSKNFVYSKKISNFDLSKETFLYLGKNNFEGIIGDFLIINKKLKRKNIKDLFYLKEDYGYILRHIYYKLKYLSKISIPKYKMNNNKPDEFKKSKEFFEQLNFEIIFEIRKCDILFSKKNKYLKNIENNNIEILDKNELIQAKEKEISEEEKYIKNNTINDNNNMIYKKNINIINIVSKMKYSYDIFYQNNGIDFLSFQLNNIFSKIDDIELLNSYLYETLLFVMDLMTYQENYYENQKNQLKKLDTEMIIFFLTLLISLLNKKDKKIYLNDNIILKLTEIYDYFKTNKIIEPKNMILSIIIDIGFYKNKEDIIKHQKIFNSFKNDIEEFATDNKSLFRTEYFYKLLLLDFTFETKQFKHKLLMELITDYILLETNTKLNINSELCQTIQKEFINYFLTLKSEIKIYHYLKIIYINFNEIKNNFFPEFIENINQNKEKINYQHCKYCAYNQILFYLINQEILKDCDDQNFIFEYIPNSFMMKPSEFLIKCFFSQIFNLSNKDRIKFIKIKYEPIDFIFSLLNNEKQIFPISEFIPKLQNIIGYINLCIKYADLNDSSIKNNILYLINLIIDFLKRLITYDIDRIQNNENKTILKNQKNEIITKDNNYNGKNIFSSNEIKNLFDIYLKLNYNNAMEDLNNLIIKSIYNISSPFYFNFLFNDSAFEENENCCGKIEVFNIIIEALVNNKITFELSKEKNFIQNNILFLIHLYNFVINEYKTINQEFENLIILFINYLKDNSFFDSKYIFTCYLSSDKYSQDNKQEKKFIMEIVCDIYFHLYELKKYDSGYECLIKGLFLDTKRMNLLDIDLKYFEEDKNKNKNYYFYNDNYLKNLADGEDFQDIIFSIYFILYLLDKKDEYENANRIKKNNFSFLLEISELLSKNNRKLIKHYSKKIKNSIKEISKNNKFKSYIKFLENIIKKYSSKHLTTDELIECYKQTILNDNKKFKRSSKRKRTLGNSSYSIPIKFDSKKRINRNFMDEINKKGNINNSSKFQPKIGKKRVCSSKNLPIEKSILFEKYDFIIDIDKKDDDILLGNIKHIVHRNIDVKLEIIQKNKISSYLDKISNESENKIVNTIKSNEDEKYLLKKLKKINIPALYYKKIFRLSEANILKRLFNPKEYYFWNKFTLILKDIIYSQQKFDIINKLYKISNINHILNYSSKKKGDIFSLKYPTKLKNFLCDDYYRPFLKPDLNFYNDKLLIKSHNYLNEKFINDNKEYNIDKISKINFPRILPFNYDEINDTSKVVCECVNDYGSIFGHLYINHAFLLFVSALDEDKRKFGNQKKYKNLKDEDFYLYSFFLEERRKDKNKYIIMYYSEIKEVVIRRFCFNYIGYEFFMKNNKSYLFNFFNDKNRKELIFIIIKKLESVKKEFNKNNNSSNYSIVKNINNNNGNLTITLEEKGEEINFNIIKDLVQYFKECNFNAKYIKGELNNFKYLLLLNKYSARSYNDLFQYLIFPLLYLDNSRTTLRDLSKAIALNKNSDRYEQTLINVQNNYENFGCHFNYHYSTSGHILYYLVRMNPFTNIHLKFQSNKFDVPKRMFYSMDNYFKAIGFSEENRELVPEFFHNYELFLNLNYSNLGYLYEENVSINDLETFDKNGIIEMIINLRQLLEKRDIIPWVDNIFGFNQDPENNINSEVYNIFAASSYEQNNDYEAMKIRLKEEGMNPDEIINQIKNSLNLLSLGICPVQLFKQPLKLKKLNHNMNVRRGALLRASIKKSVENNINKELNQFLSALKQTKSKLLLLDDNHEPKLVIRTKKLLQILKLFNNDAKNNIIQKELWQKKFIKIHPKSQMFCELYPEIMLSCRYIDATFQIHYSSKYNFQIRYDNIITSVEFFSHEEKKGGTNNNITIHKNKVILGDEIGNINLVHIEYEINNKKQMSLKRTKIEKSIKAHNSLVQGILYEKRLNIIISYSIEGQITIINAFDFNVINIIDIGNEYYIRDLKICEYDLIYIFCTNKEDEKFNYIKCYSLNGIKYTELKTEKNIINYYIHETLLVIYENNLIESFNLYDLEGKPLNQLEPKKISENSDKKHDKNKLKNIENIKIRICALNNIDKKLVIIYDDLFVKTEEVLFKLLKE